MFRKLVSNLPFSPALIHDVGFYASRLRKEEVTRQLTLIFVALTLVMQSLAVFSPPESANASSEQDIVRGGLSGLDDFLLRYERNDDDLKDIFTAIGISQSELATMRPSTIRVTDDSYLLTRYGQLSANANEASLSYQRSVGGIGVRYFSPLADITRSTATFEGWTGESPATGWFAVLKSSGGLVTRGLPSAVSAAGASNSLITKTVTATNLSQSGAPATTTAQPLDKIAYTIKAVNTGTTSATIPFSVHLSDVLEYATLIDAGGATYDSTTATLSWQQTQLAAGKSQERTFVVQLFSELPATATGQSNPASYDCTLAVSFGTRSSTPVACPPAKATESIINQLPTTSLATNIIFGGTLLAIVTYFYVRTRQLKKEIRIIRHNINTGII